jgi:hypothetical protein
MVKVPERFKRSTACPNEAAIAENNLVTPGLIRQYGEMQVISHFVSDLAGIAVSAVTELAGAIDKQAKATGYAEVAKQKEFLDECRVGLETIRSNIDTTAIEEAEDQIEAGVNKIGSLACASCDGPIIDRVTGIAYCGLEAPPELITSHQQI